MWRTRNSFRRLHASTLARLSLTPRRASPHSVDAPALSAAPLFVPRLARVYAGDHPGLAVSRIVDSESRSDIVRVALSFQSTATEIVARRRSVVDARRSIRDVRFRFSLAERDRDRSPAVSANAPRPPRNPPATPIHFTGTASDAPDAASRSPETSSSSPEAFGKSDDGSSAGDTTVVEYLGKILLEIDCQ
jgi:hypothetical protein